MIKALASEHEVSLVSLLCDDYERELVKDIARYCVSVDLVPLPKWQAYTNCICALPTLSPLRVAYYQTSALVERMRQVIRKRKIQVVHGELIKIAPMLRAVQTSEHIPVIYDAVDCISFYLKQQWGTARNRWKRAFIYTELRKMERLEPRLLSAFEHVLITSSYDRDLLLALGERPEHIHVVPNGVDLDYFAPLTQPRVPDTLVFCAKMDYYPNAQAMLTFCQDVLPHIWERRPQVRLTIAGNNPPPAVRALSEDKRIVVTGYVPDIRPYLGSAAVAVAPLHVAAGMQNKVLEALAMGTPLVATSGSCRALQTEHETHLCIADDAEAFSHEVLRLLETPSLAKELGVAGRMYVEEKHSWRHAACMLDAIYWSVIPNKRG
jgi:sugar transferase (PEP-CTERM/EpsH1 system associated)